MKFVLFCEGWTEKGALPDFLRRWLDSKLPGTHVRPETVNFDEPPARLLNRLYEEATGRTYKKRTYGEELFRKLDPHLVWEKCPYFRELADELADLAKKALPPAP